MASLTIDMALEVLPRRSSSKRPTSPEAPPSFRALTSLACFACLQVYFCSSVAGGVRVLHDQARRTAALLRRPPSMRSRVDAWGVACGAGSLDKCKGGTSLGFRSGPASAVSPDMSIC